MVYIYIKYIHIYKYLCRNFRWNKTTNILAKKLFRAFHQCAYKNLIKFLLKKQNLK